MSGKRPAAPPQGSPIGEQLTSRTRIARVLLTEDREGLCIMARAVSGSERAAAAASGRRPGPDVDVGKNAAHLCRAAAKYGTDAITNSTPMIGESAEHGCSDTTDVRMRKPKKQTGTAHPLPGISSCANTTMACKRRGSKISRWTENSGAGHRQSRTNGRSM